MHRRLRSASPAPSPRTAGSDLHLLHPIPATWGQMCISCNTVHVLQPQICVSCSKSMHRRVRPAFPAPHPCSMGALQAQTCISCSKSMHRSLRSAPPALHPCNVGSDVHVLQHCPCTAGSDLHLLHPILAAWVHCSSDVHLLLQVHTPQAQICISCTPSLQRGVRRASPAPSPCTAGSDLHLLHPILATGGQMCISCSESTRRSLRSASPAPHPCNVGSDVHLLLQVHASQAHTRVS